MWDGIYTPVLILFVSCYLVHSLKFRQPVLGIRAHRSSITRLNSLGDPDNSLRWRFLRWWQRTARGIDNALLFHERDIDVPGWTFPSPVQWAPWMETIWFGNLYDYRSAYFHDVMYSNGQQPFREGALLFKDPQRALQLALLYQRYDKFDPASSYTVSNGTFFNVFATESLRAGRFKVPLSDELILCTTEPLTFSQMKRYLTSFQALKWWKSLFFQQLRKRQAVVQIPVANCDNFFADAYFEIEYKRVLEAVPINKRSQSICIATLPVAEGLLSTDRNIINHTVEGPPNTSTEAKGEEDNAIHSASIEMEMAIANSQYLLENLAQCLVDYLTSLGRPPSRIKRLVVGGDGRLFSDVAFELLLRVFSANGISVIELSSDGILTPAAASSLLQEDDMAVVMGASGKAGGVRGYFGLTVIDGTLGSLKLEDWENIIDRLQKSRYVQISPDRVSEALRRGIHTADLSSVPSITSLFPGGGPRVSIQNYDQSFGPYMNDLLARYEVKRLDNFLTSKGLLLAVDCLHGAGSHFIKKTLDKIFPKASSSESIFYLNNQRSPNFENRIPECDNILNCKESDEAFCISSNDVVDYQGPDVGFAFNSDASKCSLFLPGFYLASQDIHKVLPATGRPKTNISPRDGVSQMLAVLTLFVDNCSGSDKAFGEIARTIVRDAQQKNIAESNSLESNEPTMVEYSSRVDV